MDKKIIELLPYPLDRYKFGLPKFFSKTFQFFIIFYSTWQILVGGQWRKECRSREKEWKQSKITWKQSEPVRSISTIQKRREIVRALWYEQCPKNSFKRFYTLKGLLVLVEKASFSKEFWSEIHSGGGGKSYDLTVLTRLQGHQFEPCSPRIRQWPDEIGGQHPFELRSPRGRPQYQGGATLGRAYLAYRAKSYDLPFSHWDSLKTRNLVFQTLDKIKKLNISSQKIT